MNPDMRSFNRRILLVEDEFIQGFDLRNELLDRGTDVIGPVGTLALVMEHMKRDAAIDAAVVDVNLSGELSFPVVDELIQRDVRVVFATACRRDVVPFRLQHIPICEKPISSCKSDDTVGALLGAA